LTIAFRMAWIRIIRVSPTFLLHSQSFRHCSTV